MIARRVDQEPCCLAENRFCLGCHGAGVQDGKDLKHEAGSRPEEGVTCESCHGPAAAHVAAARQKKQRPCLVSSLRHPERACQDCHRHKASHEHEGTLQFEEKCFRKKIEHGLENPPVADWLRRGPLRGPARGGS